MLLLNLLITLLLEEGRIARHFHYVESGMLRQYYYKNGHDITEHFSCEDDLVFCIISLFRQEPTRLMIEAIEPTVVYDIPIPVCKNCLFLIPLLPNYTRKF